MLKLKELSLLTSRRELSSLPDGKLLINTINAHSYNTALKDSLFAEALSKGNVRTPDEASVVMVCQYLKAKSQPTKHIAGWDLSAHKMERLNFTKKYASTPAKKVKDRFSNQEELSQHIKQTK